MRRRHIVMLRGASIEFDGRVLIERRWMIEGTMYRGLGGEFVRRPLCWPKEWDRVFPRCFCISVTFDGNTYNYSQEEEVGDVAPVEAELG